MGVGGCGGLGGCECGGGIRQLKKNLKKTSSYQLSREKSFLTKKKTRPTYGDFGKKMTLFF